MTKVLTPMSALDFPERDATATNKATTSGATSSDGAKENMSELPETPVTVLEDTTEEAEFTPAQQVKINTILKNAMGRAGSSVRAENADLKAKLAAAEKR